MNPFMIFLGLSMLAVLASLFVGLFAMGKADAILSQKAMRARVALQGLAVLLFILAMVFGRS